MRNFRFVVSALAIMIGIAVAADTMASDPKPPARAPKSAPAAIALDFSVSPMSGSSKEYVCEAVFTDLATGKVISQPQIVVEIGFAGEIRGGIASSDGNGVDGEVHLSVLVKSEKVVTYEATVSRGGAIAFRQSAKISL